MSLILKQYLQTSNDANIKNINKINNEKITNSTFYDQVNALQRSQITYYLFFAIIAYYIFSKVQINTNMILASAFIFGTIYYMINNDNNTLKNDAINYSDKLRYLESSLFASESRTKRKNPYKNILNILPNNMPPEHKSYLHMSKPVVEFYFSIRELSQYNPSTFTSSLRSMNNLLQLNVIMEAGAERPKYTLDNAIIQRDNCLNSLQATILSLPSSKLYDDFFNKSMQTLQEILALYINAMTKIARNKFKEEQRDGTISINSQPVISDAPNPNDTTSYNFSENFNFY